MRYPHQLSGGQRQRVCIARALVVNPKLLICDEPTSSLDVWHQAQMMDLLLKLQQDYGLSYLLITHNLSVVRSMAHSIAVMVQGRIVEYGTKESVLETPKDPFTQRLLKAIPALLLE
jgi:peptide/nickel transport system ATP-binding protein